VGDVTFYGWLNDRRHVKNCDVRFGRDIVRMRIFLLLCLFVTAARSYADIGVAFDAGVETCEFLLTQDVLIEISQKQWQEYKKSECNDGFNSIKIYIFNEIKPEDATYFRQALPRILEISRTQKVQVPSFWLTSLGGDVFAAIEIGDLIRKNFSEKNITWVPNGADCVSACVIIYASGAERGIGIRSRLGIHRPYPSDERFLELGYDNRQKAYEHLYQLLRTAFKQYNISLEIVDHMWSIPSTKVHYLTSEEITRYRLRGVDLVQQETDDALLRKHCGKNAHALKNSYERESIQLGKALQKSCSERFPVPKECDFCGSKDNGCSPECAEANRKHSTCASYANDNFRRARKVIEEKHKQYLECHAEYSKEKNK
jgi:hypothetical protein